MNTPSHISYSQMNLYGNCAEAYRRRYVEREVIPPGVAALRGRAVHGAIEHNHRQKKKSRIDLPLDVLKDFAAQAFGEAKADSGYSLTPDEQAEGGDRVLRRTKDNSIALAGLYHQAVAPSIQPDLIEERIEIQLKNHPAKMVGILDVVTEDGRIKDFKTKARSPAKGDAETSAQLTWYAMSYHALTGKPPTGLDLEALVNTKVPKHVRLITSRTPDDYHPLVARINTVLAARDAGVYAPANPDHWMCGEKWCGYWHTCHYVNASAERRSAGGDK